MIVSTGANWALSTDSDAGQSGPDRLFGCLTDRSQQLWARKGRGVHVNRGGREYWEGVEEERLCGSFWLVVISLNSLDTA
jgi:hypothetical protein